MQTYTCSEIAFLMDRRSSVLSYLVSFGGCKPKAGLTIIEILLVTAITAVLTTIVLPLIIRGRELSYRAKCSANLGQFAAAFYLYSQDWDDFWPSPGGLAGDYAYWAQTGKGGLESYIKQRGPRSTWCCPYLTEWRSKYPARTYSMNSYLRTPADIEYPGCVSLMCGINTSRVGDPRRTILLYEGVQLTTGWENTPLYNYIYRCANWTWVRGYTDKVAYTVNPGKPAHGRFNNYLYCDGHIVARPPGKRTAAQLSTFREMYEWYVDKARYEDNYRRYWSRLIPRDCPEH
jgi:prepilin-type processing-associated H-X9-DG protein